MAILKKRGSITAKSTKKTSKRPKPSKPSSSSKKTTTVRGKPSSRATKKQPRDYEEDSSFRQRSGRSSDPRSLAQYGFDYSEDPWENSWQNSVSRGRRTSQSTQSTGKRPYSTKKQKDVQGHFGEQQGRNYRGMSQGNRGQTRGNVAGSRASQNRGRQNQGTRTTGDRTDRGYGNDLDVNYPGDSNSGRNRNWMQTRNRQDEGQRTLPNRWGRDSEFVEDSDYQRYGQERSGRARRGNGITRWEEDYEEDESESSPRGRYYDSDVSFEEEDVDYDYNDVNEEDENQNVRRRQKSSGPRSRTRSRH